MYAITSNSKNPIFQLNSHIGFDHDSKSENGEVVPGDGQGIDGRIFSRELFEQDGYSPDMITMYVNTMGGDVQQSLDIFTALSRLRSKTKSIISGFAYSCGGWIPLAADIVEMTENSRWMCHMPYNPLNPEQKSDFLDSVVDMISTTLADKSGRNKNPKKTKEQIVDLMKSTTYLTAQQMFDEGLIDRIVTASGKLIKVEIPEKYDPMNFVEVKSFYKETQKALNLFISTQTEKKQVMAYVKLINRLNSNKVVIASLTEDAHEDDIIGVVSRIENKFNSTVIEKNELSEQLIASNNSKTEAEKKLKEMQDKVAKNEDDMASDKATIEKMKNEYDSMVADNKILKEKQKISDDNAAAEVLNLKKDKATKLVMDNQHKFSATNKVEKDRIIANAIEKATADYEGMEIMFSGLAVNMHLPTPGSEQFSDDRPDSGDGSASNYIKQNQQIRKEKYANVKYTTGKED